MNINKILVLDAMGVIYQSCDDVEELLVPFIREKGSNIDKKTIEDLYTRASLGEFSSEKFWAKVGVDYNLEDEYLDRHRLSVGLLDFLSAFKSQVKAPIYCLSNDVSEWSIKLRKKFQLDQYIEKWFISGDSKIRKPSSGIYDVLIRESNVKPTQMLFVDDREKNIAAANEFGIQTILCKMNNEDGYNDEGESTVIYSFLNSTRKCNRLGSWHRKGQLVYFPRPFQTQLPTEALMGTYHQLTEYQRYQIYALKKAGHDQQRIAATLEVSPSTICRELRRNQGQRGYRPGQAHHKALARRRHKAKATKMTPAVIERIEADLRQQWSPEQIAGRLEVTDGLRLSPQRIYQHIQADRQAGGTLYRHLRHSQKKRKKRYGQADGRGQIKDRVSIDLRPAIVEKKSRIGDWEIDLVLGGQGTGALISVVERRSRYTVLGKVPSKQAEHVAAAIIALLAPHKGHTQTITADNGKEFAHHTTISQALDAAVYFAHPYHAWERGLNENTNGLIRQYVPKGTALDTLSQAQIHHIMDRLNHRPRKGLAFQTPHEILCKETGVQPRHGEIALTS